MAAEFDVNVCCAWTADVLRAAAQINALTALFLETRLLVDWKLMGIPRSEQIKVHLEVVFLVGGIFTVVDCIFYCLLITAITLRHRL